MNTNNNIHDNQYTYNYQYHHEYQHYYAYAKKRKDRWINKKNIRSLKLLILDIESITNVQGQFTECTNSLGLLQIDEKTLSNQLLMIEEKKNEIFNKFDELRKQEQELVQSLQEKYGQGQINLQEGTFTPNN